MVNSEEGTLLIYQEVILNGIFHITTKRIYAYLMVSDMFLSM